MLLGSRPMIDEHIIISLLSISKMTCHFNDIVHNPLLALWCMGLFELVDGLVVHGGLIIKFSMERSTQGAAGTSGRS